MFNKSKKLLALGTAALMVTFALTGCQGGDSGTDTANSAKPTINVTPNPDSTLSGSLKITGSTTVEPVMKKLADHFKAANVNVEISIEGNDSGTGIKQTNEGNNDIGMASRELKEDEIAAGAKPVSIAIDGIAIIVSKDNPVENLTMEQVQKIYKGEVSSWSELGVDYDEDILPITREDGSGTRSAFQELFKLEGDKDPSTGKKPSLINTQVCEQQTSTGNIVNRVAAEKAAIGYVSAGSLKDTVKAVKVDGTECNETTLKDQSYKYQRQLFVMTKGDAQGLAKEFIDYILSDDGQKIIADNGYLSIK